MHERVYRVHNLRTTCSSTASSSLLSYMRRRPQAHRLQPQAKPRLAPLLPSPVCSPFPPSMVVVSKANATPGLRGPVPPFRL